MDSIDPTIQDNSMGEVYNNTNQNIDQQFINQYMKEGQGQSDDLMIFDNDLYIENSIDNDNSGVTNVDDKKDIQLVEYDHEGKTQRLGRPRNHGLSHIKSGEKDSSKNEVESKYMRYRLNDNPVEGPGSRGGKIDNKVKKGTITGEKLKKMKDDKKQSQLVFSKNGLGLNNSETPDIEKEIKGESGDSDQPKTKKMKVSQSPTPLKLEISSEIKVPKSSEPESVEPTFDGSASRTTVTSNRSKISRQFPGPLVPLTYDLYDDTLMTKEKIEEPLAFGFETKKIYYGEDLVFLMSYLLRFQDIIGLGYIGPQDIEEGIGLIRENDDDEEVPPVSDKMNELFSRLVTLVLNRKTEVNPKYQGKAVSELKAVFNSLGIPKEWRDLNEPYEKFQLDKELFEPVDSNNPEILIEEYYKPRLLQHYVTPFNDKLGFEKIGFPGISDPNDRLIILSSLATWTLTSSNEIKSSINETVQKQDIPGDKETYYGSRSILNGFKHSETLTRETNDKISKKNYKEDNEMVAKYVEPISNPLDHGLKFRVEEMVIGDLGFKIGRFYLLKMADEKSGKLSSTKKMQSAWNRDYKNVTSSRFKLYVQDVHGMLTEQFKDEGVEFDSEGNDVIHERPEGINSFMYEVASNCKELEAFINHLSSKISKTEIDSIIYQPMRNLLEILSNNLPLLQLQEENLSTANPKLPDRNLKKKKVDYDMTKYRSEEDLENVVIDDNEDEDYEEEEVVIADDDEEDDDYYD